MLKIIDIASATKLLDFSRFTTSCGIIKIIKVEDANGEECKLKDMYVSDYAVSKYKKTNDNEWLLAYLKKKSA